MVNIDNSPISQDDFVKLLNSCYQKCIDGIPNICPSIDKFANDYLAKSKSPEEAAKRMIQTQILKCSISGFVTGLGGLITLPVAIPVNLSSVLFIQMRMIACTAYLAGFDVQTDQVQTLIFACLAGISITEVMKKFGIKFGEKITHKMIEKIPVKVIHAINKKAGFRLLTKFGEKGLINLGKSIPVVGAIVNSGFDLSETKVIGSQAIRFFFKGNFDNNSNGPEKTSQKEVDEIQIIDDDNKLQSNEEINPSNDSCE